MGRASVPGRNVSGPLPRVSALAQRDHYVVILQELSRQRTLVSSAGSSVEPHPQSRAGRGVRQPCDRAGRTPRILRGPPAPCCRPAREACARSHFDVVPPWSLEDRIRGILDEQRPTSTRTSGFARSVTVTLSVAICGLVAMPQLTASQTGDQSETKTKAAASLRVEAGAGRK